MALKAKLCLSLLVLSVFVVCALAVKDPELEQCKHQCDEQRGFDTKQKQDCKRRCDDYYKEKKEREEREEGRGRHDDDDDEPEKKLRECQRRCEGYQGQQRELCRLRCQERQEKEHVREEDDANKKRREEEEEEEEQEQEGGEEHPYVFEEEHFTTKGETEHGKFDVLQRFNKRSKLLRGLENYRLEVLIANPHTFAIPKHVDAEGLYFVAKGRATLTMIRENKRESHNLETGDLIGVRSGTPTYVVNRDANEKLYIIKLFRPVNIPDKYEEFFGPGGENPESFFRAFSTEVLEAAFRTDRSTLEKIFKQQTEGPIIKASRQQIQALSQHEEGGSIWPFPGGETSRRGSINLFKQRPTESNDYGELREVDTSDCRFLKELGVMVSFANISRGSMIGPYFNSKATKISIVVGGEGYFEMACPHVASGSSRTRHGETEVHSKRRESRQSYQKIRSRLKVGTVFIVPAGHPVAAVASRSNNLQILCFEVNAEGNLRYPLAGRGNIIKLMEKEAKELAFNTKAEEVDQVFGRQDLKFFFPGPGQHREREGRAFA